MYNTNRLSRLLILLVIVLALPATQASAALTRCRTDPVFVLSNGDIVTVTVDISADPSQVQNVIYALHVSEGVTVREVVHIARGLGIEEIYEVYEDSTPGIYSTSAIVTTQDAAGIVAVIAYTRLNGVRTQSVYGYSSQQLVATISRDQYPNNP